MANTVMPFSCQENCGQGNAACLYTLLLSAIHTKGMPPFLLHHKLFHTYICSCPSFPEHVRKVAAIHIHAYIRMYLHTHTHTHTYVHTYIDTYIDT